MELPRAKEAEKQVIANMLFSPDIMIETFARLNADDFFEPENKIIFETINELRKKANVEPYSLIDALTASGNLERVGGASYILELSEAYNDIANATYFINSVEEKSILRQMIAYSSKIVNKWNVDSAEDISDYILKIKKDVNEITDRRKVEDFVSMDEAFKQYQGRLSDIRSGARETGGIMTGYQTFDNIMLGFKPGEIYILAARPSVGKTALALNFLVKAAQHTNKKCVFFSLEMGVDQVTNRILSSKSDVPIRKIQTATFDKSEEISINKAMRDISSRNNIFIDETPAIKTVNIRAKLNKLQVQYGEIGLVVIDYIGLISPDVKSKGGDASRSLELGAISAAIKAIARDFKCPVLVLSQLNRSVEGNSDNRPKLSNLRESGSIEQDADVVMFIHRDDYGKKQEATTSEQDPNATSDSAVELIIAKNRNGNLATINFMFQKHIGRFVEMDTTH